MLGYDCCALRALFFRAHSTNDNTGLQSRELREQFPMTILSVLLPVEPRMAMDFINSAMRWE